MKLVSDNSESDIKAREQAREETFATQQVTATLVELAANIMRVTRGAGRPHDVGPQALRLVEAYRAYRDVTGHFPASHDIAAALSIDAESKDGGPWSFWSGAMLEITKGGLQMAASELLGQRTQSRAGQSEALEGVIILEWIRAQNRLKAQGKKMPERPLGIPSDYDPTAPGHG